MDLFLLFRFFGGVQYGGDSIGHTILQIQTDGVMRPFWLAMIFFNIVVPWLTLWSKKIRTSPVPLFIIALGVNIGMFLERYIIVTGFQRRNRLPFNWGDYQPSIIEIAIVVGSIAAFLFIYGLLTESCQLSRYGRSKKDRLRISCGGWAGRRSLRCRNWRRRVFMTKDERAVVMGRFRDVDRAADVLDQLREFGIAEDDVEVLSGYPFTARDAWAQTSQEHTAVD